MTSTAPRRSYRVVALLLLLVSVWTSSHPPQDDAACRPSVEGEHDASKHAFAPLAPADHEHCAVCHWMRGLKPAFTATTISWGTLSRAGNLAAPPVYEHAAPIGGRLPARAPPSLL